MDYSERVAQRDTGGIPISIGTAFALERLGPPDQTSNPIETKIPKLPDELWLNCQTLFRNLYSALESDVKKRVLSRDFVPVVLDEVEFILNYVKEQTSGQVKCVFYINELSDISRRHPDWIIAEAKTDNQLVYEEHLTEAMRALYGKFGEKPFFKTFKGKLRGRNKTAWILTHEPYDLLSHPTFNELTLLESHKGTFKPKSQWYLKLGLPKDSMPMPFNEFMLGVYGGGLVRGQPIRIKRIVNEVAENFRWNATTTRDKIKYSLASVEDLLVQKFLLGLV